MAQRPHIIGTTGMGYLASCAAVENSNWGVVEDFYADMWKGGKVRNGLLHVEATVFGKRTLPAGVLPERGDGFAVYHSLRAVFPDGDPFKKQPRVSAIAELLGTEVDNGNLAWIHMAFDPDLLKLMQAHPIIRNGAARAVLEACGIRSGPPASYYRADKAVWRRLLALLPS